MRRLVFGVDGRGQRFNRRQMQTAGLFGLASFGASMSEINSVKPEGRRDDWQAEQARESKPLEKGECEIVLNYARERRRAGNNNETPVRSCCAVIVRHFDWLHLAARLTGGLALFKLSLPKQRKSPRRKRMPEQLGSSFPTPGKWRPRRCVRHLGCSTAHDSSVPDLRALLEPFSRG